MKRKSLFVNEVYKYGWGWIRIDMEQTLLQIQDFFNKNKRGRIHTKEHEEMSKELFEGYYGSELE